MSTKLRKVPAYCRHKATGRAVVRLDGRDHYLGKFGTPGERYLRLIAQQQSGDRTVDHSPAHSNAVARECVSVVELLAEYWRFAETYYRKNGHPTTELASIKLAFRPLKALFGFSPAKDFGPLSLELVRTRMIEAGITRKRINQHVGRIRRAFKWAASKELIPVTVYHSLMTMTGLRRRRSTATESVPILPVDWADVVKTGARLNCQLWAMVQLQFHYPTDVSDEEWALVAPYLTLMDEDAPQREHSLRDVFNALRWIVRAGAPWRLLPNDFPPWSAVDQQSQRWIAAGVFERLVHDLRALLRISTGRSPQPTAAIFDGRVMQSTPESGARAGYDGHKRKKGSKVHMAVDTLGDLLVTIVTAANEQERAQVSTLAAQVQAVTGHSVELAYVDQGYTGEQAEDDAEEHGIHLEVVKLPEAKRGFVLLPRRWVVERSFAWMARFRRLARDYERLPETLASLHFIAFACLMLRRLTPELGTLLDILKSA